MSCDFTIRSTAGRRLGRHMVHAGPKLKPAYVLGHNLKLDSGSVRLYEYHELTTSDGMNMGIQELEVSNLNLNRTVEVYTFMSIMKAK